MQLVAASKRLIGGATSKAIRLGVNADWMTVIIGDSLVAALSVERLSAQLEKDGARLRIVSPDVQGLSALRMFVGGSDSLFLGGAQVTLVNMLLEVLQSALKRQALAREKKRMAQGGPRVMQHVATTPAIVESDLEDLHEYRERLAQERSQRYLFIHSFGELEAPLAPSAAQLVAEGRDSCVDGLLPVSEIKPVMLELGYELGNELEGAMYFLDHSGSGYFSFRDIVSWWSQSNRSWLFLLDDAAFKQRHSAVEIFLRNDPGRDGKVRDDKLLGIVRGMRAAKLTTKSEHACKQGLDPTGSGVLHMNEYVDWLCRMRIAADRAPI